MEEEVIDTQEIKDEDLKNKGMLTPKVEVPTLAILAPLVMLLVGIYIAYKRNSKFWGWVGWILLSSIVGGAISRTLFLMKNKDVIVSEI